MSRLLLSILICYCYSQLVASRDPSKNTVIVQILIIMVLYSVIIQPPQSQSVCEGGAVNFTCVVMFTNATPGSVTWLTNNGDGSTTGLPGHTPIVGNTAVPPPANITNVLVVTNARLIDDGRDYICQQGIRAISEPVLLTVLGKLQNFVYTSLYVHMYVAMYYVFILTYTLPTYVHIYVHAILFIYSVIFTHMDTCGTMQYIFRVQSAMGFHPRC